MKKLNMFLLLSFYYIFGGVINVPDDHSTISAAVDNANSGDTIFVSSGTYNESLWFSKHVHIIGDGLDGTMLWISDVFESDAVTIQNFEFTNGYSDMGSHLYISNSKVDFINVRITENFSDSGSGGGLNINGESEVGLHNSHILSNTAYIGGGIYIYSGGLGGGGCNHKASLSITNTEIAANISGHDGGAIYIDDKCSDVSVHSSVILDNQSGNNGGGILNKGHLIIENSSIFDNNSGDSGSAFAIINHDTTHIKNCTVTDNYGNSLVMLEEESGNDASEVLIDHSIFYTNQQESFNTVEGNVPVHVVNSLIEDYESISSNLIEWNVTGFVLDEDPQFSDGGDQFCPFPLSPNSPFINEGIGACNSSQSSSTGRLYVNSEIGDDDNNGTEDFPLSSINRAITLSDSGDTVYVSSGIYYENIN